MKRLLASLLALAATAAAVPASAATRYPDPIQCGPGVPAYTGWNYWNLKAYGLGCRNAHSTAEEYVYDFSTEGVIEPPEHWKACRDKQVAARLWRGKCKRVKDGDPQKIVFFFSGPDQPWYR
jgi:hypothetical protein